MTPSPKNLVNEQTASESSPAHFKGHNIETLQPNITTDVKTKQGGRSSEPQHSQIKRHVAKVGR
jgi:hypothetical protein